MLRHQKTQSQSALSAFSKITLVSAAIWLLLVTGIGWWISQTILKSQLNNLAASADYESTTTAHVMDRVFTEMSSIANMVSGHADVIRVAVRYRTDPPGFANLTRQERAVQLTRDPLVRKVGDLMNGLAGDLRYARIYMNNLSDDTVTASNWAENDSIVGMIYTGRPYLIDALRTGKGSSFGIARLNKTPSYFVTSRIDDANNESHGSVTVKFDAPDVATYLTGRHIALIVNRQGRVITSSSPEFMLRNVAQLMPAGTVLPPDGEEELGETMDVRTISHQMHENLWAIDGKPYLVIGRPLSGTHYQLFTLASLEQIAPMQRQHFWTAGFVGLLGLVFILLAAQVVRQSALRRQDELYAANYDVLTDLPNRRAVLVELDRLFTLAKRTRQWVLVVFIDLDSFKAINDTYGHDVGDKFLIEAGRRLSEGLRASDMLGRFGGDEFIVIGQVSPPNSDDPEENIDAIRNRLAPLLIGIYRFENCSFEYSGASFGIACVDPSVSSLKSALREADQLMYADKKLRQKTSRTKYRK
ncbi:sensor domain-containing diguanylate cyclase [Ochrobactrum sp. SFR4]|uniref:sensor domain-containing diguanylate cyclase n=1 Tax=Ochrobactrum sp. SFR4 TaxID=2717368 RepID=UPI001C8BB577